MEKINKTYSRNFILLRILSIVLLLGALLFGLYILYKYKIIVNEVSTENASLKSDYTELKDSTFKITDFILSNPCLINKSDTIISFLPLKAVIRPIVTYTPLNKKGYNDYELYNFSLHLDMPENKKKEIKKVNYHFTHAYPFDLKSKNPNNNFLVQYEGWGCFMDVKISIFLNNNDTIIMHYDMCKGLNW